MPPYAFVLNALGPCYTIGLLSSVAKYMGNKGTIMAEDNRCAHEACGCTVIGDAKYCSDHCRDAVDQDIVEIACDCGHKGCG
jgi:hypothetical protein